MLSFRLTMLLQSIQIQSRPIKGGFALKGNGLREIWNIYRSPILPVGGMTAKHTTCEGPICLTISDSPPALAPVPRFYH
jgi:hypothetical protein